LAPLETADFAMVRKIATMQPPPTLPMNRDPRRDTIGMLALLNAKTELVARAVAEGLVETEFTGFIDSGIAGLFADPAGSFAAIRDCRLDGLDRVLAPGCWPPAPVAMATLLDSPVWHFCGSLFFLPSEMAAGFHQLADGTLDAFLQAGRLTWEVNVWALLAANHPECFAWYRADHNDEMAMVPDFADAATRHLAKGT
ncbi:MAG: hypothetical protein ACR2J8_09650, partial [Thermomicrobiales bacterium]